MSQTSRAEIAPEVPFGSPIAVDESSGQASEVACGTVGCCPSKTQTWGWDLHHPVDRAAWLSRYRYEQSGPPHRDGPLLLIYSGDGWEHILAPGFPFTSVTNPSRAFDRAQSYADEISRLAFDPAANVAGSGVLPPMVLTQDELAGHLGDRESVRNAVATGLYGSSAQAARLLLQMGVRAWPKTVA